MNYRLAIEEVVAWTKQKYQHPLGGLARGISGGILSKEQLFNDFGDYIPFFAFLGEREFCAEQMAALRSHRLKNYLLPPEFKYLGIPCTRSYEHSDYLLGLLDIFEQLPGIVSKKEMEDNLSVVHEYFFSSNIPHSWVFDVWPHQLPLADCKDGIFVELFVDASRVLNEPRYLDWAEKIADFFVRAKKNNGLLPNVVPSNKIGSVLINFLTKKEQRSHIGIIKYNISWWWALLALYRVSKKDDWLKEIHMSHSALCDYLLTADGAVMTGEWEVDKIIPDEIKLVENFPALDWLIDCAFFLQDVAFLKTAEKIACFWLKQQSATTGLFPAIAGGIVDDMDNNTDMIIALIKLAEMTGNSVYAEAADRAIEGTWKFHRVEHEKIYAHSVDISTGKIVDGGAKIKFICLWLKVLIVRSTGRSPLSDLNMWSLLRDR